MPTKTHAVPPTTTTFLYDNTWGGVGVPVPPTAAVVPAPPARLSVTPRRSATTRKSRRRCTTNRTFRLFHMLMISTWKFWWSVRSLFPRRKRSRRVVGNLIRPGLEGYSRYGAAGDAGDPADDDDTSST